MKNHLHKISIIVVLILSLVSCKVKYSFSGADIDPNIKTMSIQYFDNNSGNGPANMSNLFTEALKDKLLRETNLKLVTENADIEFKGFIEQYYYTVQAPTGAETTDLRRITMKVKVEYVNTILEDDSWISSFQNHAEHNVDLDLNSIEEESITIITNLIVDEIFTKAFVKW